MLSVDCWRHLVFILGTHKKGSRSIIALSTVCKNAYRAVRENGTQFLRWKMNQDFVTSMAQNQYPWFSQIRAVTVSYDNMEYFWIRTSRWDIKDVKVLFMEKEEYEFEVGSKVFDGLTHIEFQLGHNTGFFLSSLPEGVETFKIERMGKFQTSDKGYIKVPEIYPDSLRVLKLYVDFECSYGCVFPPNLRVLKSKSYYGSILFDIVDEKTSLEKITCVRLCDMCVCDHITEITGTLKQVKELTFITRYGYCSCKILLLDKFPSLVYAKTNKLYFKEEDNSNTVISKYKTVDYKYDTDIITTTLCHKVTFRHEK